MIEAISDHDERVSPERRDEYLQAFKMLKTQTTLEILKDMGDVTLTICDFAFESGCAHVKSRFRSACNSSFTMSSEVARSTAAVMILLMWATKVFEITSSD